MKRIFIHLFCVALGWAAGRTSAEAQVPQLLNYQGRIVSNGTNFTGLGQFKFALVNGPGTHTFWSNNNSSSGGGEPNAAVTVPVTNGLYSVLLGDTTLANMGAIPATVFTNADVRLRIWFNNGVNGSQLLAPDQRLAAVGYAMMAANLSDGAVTAAKIADGAVTDAKIGNVGAAKITSGTLADARLSANVALLGTAQQFTANKSFGIGSQLLADPGSAASPGVTFRADGDTGIFRPAANIVAVTTEGVERVRIGSGGVGIGTTSPGATLRVQGVATLGDIWVSPTTGGGNADLFMSENSSGTYGSKLRHNGAANVLEFIGVNGGVETSPLVTIGRGGSSGVSIANDLTVGGTVRITGDDNDAGLIELKNTNGTPTVRIQGAETTNSGPQIELFNARGTRTIQIDGDDPAQGGWIGLYNQAGVATIELDANRSGGSRITTEVLEITGGSDLSENFDIQPVAGELAPGMVVCIDSANPGHLITSGTAYDRTVAGVVSGAGGVKPGMLMGQRGTKADGAHPVALTGRVYCMVDAGQEAIRPGDLITTSDTPGHGMKASDVTRAHGAIIGKAMTGLSEGKGLVLVLVSLQ